MMTQYKTPEMLDSIKSESQNYAPALLVDISPTQRIAFAVHYGVEVLESPVIQPVPCSAVHSLGMVRWQNRWIPLMNLEALLAQTPKHSSDSQEPPAHKDNSLTLALVLACDNTGVANAPSNDEQLDASQQVKYGAVLLHRVPFSVGVTNRDQCQMPSDNRIWQHIAISCFRHENKPTPIVSPSKLFNGAWI